MAIDWDRPVEVRQSVIWKPVQSCIFFGDRYVMWQGLDRPFLYDASCAYVIRNKPVKVTRWVNVYENDEEPGFFSGCTLYETFEAAKADDFCYISESDRVVATVKVEFEI